MKIVSYKMFSEGRSDCDDTKNKNEQVFLSIIRDTPV